MSKELTAKQRSVLVFIIQYAGRYGYPPTIREIGAEFGIKSLRGVTVHLDALERKGYIRRESKSRTIQVLKSPNTTEAGMFVHLPLLGTIAAGTPLLAVENIETEVPVPRAMLGTADGAFLLRVRGDSMVDAHILDGDLVVIRSQQTVENGDLVAAPLDDEATVKRFRTDGEGMALVPANRAYEPVPLRDSDVRLIGKVIGLLRTY